MSPHPSFQRRFIVDCRLTIDGYGSCRLPIGDCELIKGRDLAILNVQFAIRYRQPRMIGPLEVLQNLRYQSAGKVARETLDGRLVFLEERRGRLTHLVLFPKHVVGV